MHLCKNLRNSMTSYGKKKCGRHLKHYDTANLWLSSVSFNRIHKNSIFHKNLLVQK